MTLARIFSVALIVMGHTRLRGMLEVAPTITIGSCRESFFRPTPVPMVPRSINDLLDRFRTTTPMILDYDLGLRVVAVGRVALKWDSSVGLVALVAFLLGVFECTPVIVIGRGQPGKIRVQVRGHDYFVGFAHVALCIVPLPILVRALL